MITSSKQTTQGNARDVVFRLLVEQDPRNRIAMREFLLEVSQAQKKMNEARPGVTATREAVVHWQQTQKAVKDATTQVAELKTRLDTITATYKAQTEEILKNSGIEKREMEQRLIQAEKLHAAEMVRIQKESEKRVIEAKKAADAEIAEAKRVTIARDSESAKQKATHERFVSEQMRDYSTKMASSSAIQSSGRSVSGSTGSLLAGGALTGGLAYSLANGQGSTLLNTMALGLSVKENISDILDLSDALRRYFDSAKMAAEATKSLRIAQLATKLGPGKEALASSLITTGAAPGAAGGLFEAGAIGGGAELAGSGVAVAVSQAAIIVTGLVMSLITLKEQLDGTAKAAEGMTGALMRLFAPMTDWAASIASSMGFLGGDRTKKMEAEAAALAEKKRVSDLWGEYNTIGSQGRANMAGARWAHTIGGIMTDYANESFGGTPNERMNAVRTAQIRNLQMRDELSAVQTFGDSAMRVKAERELKQLSENRMQLLKEEYSLVEQSAAKAVEGSREKLRLLEDQKKVQQQIAKEAEERYMTGKERFGNMNQSDQMRTVQAQLAFKYAERLDSGSAADRQRAAAIRASIPAEDRQRLAGLGLTEGVNFNRRAALENADRSGFTGIFGGEEISAKSRADQASASIAVNIANENKVIVNVNSNLEAQKAAIKRELQTEFAIQQAANNAELERKIKAEFEAMEKRQRDIVEKIGKKETHKGSFL